MQFDLFHSVGRIDSITPKLNDQDVFAGFFSQVKLAEKLGFSTIWVAESHFSSEVQKSGSQPVIQYYEGEVGLNADPFQLAHQVFSRTDSIGFGTAIHNIVGGNGGPIASADRVRTLAFYNEFLDQPRRLDIGIAQGRFPYINAPFGIFPRNERERALWEGYKRLIFLESLEIFLRLSHGEILSSDAVSDYLVDEPLFSGQERFESALTNAGLKEPPVYDGRWFFEPLQLVPSLTESAKSKLNFVLGSSDPLARDVAFRFADPDIFNLSFTSPNRLQAIHDEMTQFCLGRPRPWTRDRLPRTVLVFIDESHATARKRAESCFDTYLEAMRGTVGVPPRDTLMERALIGDPSSILEQVSDPSVKGIHQDDRLMLWFEFNQAEHRQIEQQMCLFADKVMAKLL